LEFYMTLIREFISGSDSPHDCNGCGAGMPCVVIENLANENQIVYLCEECAADLVVADGGVLAEAVSLFVQAQPVAA
jgi:hypothetical protein